MSSKNFFCSNVSDVHVNVFDVPAVGVAEGSGDVAKVQECTGTIETEFEMLMEPGGKPKGLASKSMATTDNVVQKCTNRLIEAAEATPTEGDCNSDSERKLDKQRKQKRKRLYKRQKLAQAKSMSEDGEDPSIINLTERIAAITSAESTPEEAGPAKRVKHAGTGSVKGGGKEAKCGSADGQPGHQEVSQSQPRVLTATEQSDPGKEKRKLNRTSGKKATKAGKKQPYARGEQANAGKDFKTFAQAAASDLRMGVVDMGREGGLAANHLDIFKNALLVALDSLPQDAGDIGVRDVSLEEGFIALKCANQESRDWLCEAVGKMTSLWEGINLKVDRLHVLKDVERVMIFVPGATQSKEIILGRLCRQNSCVKDTSKWRVSRTERYGDAATGGTQLTIWCPKEDAEAVKRAGGKLNCGLDLAFVKFRKVTEMTQLGAAPGRATK